MDPDTARPTVRQIELADAALTIIARAGMTGLTFRAVAAEAGCSVGAVQKAFPSKERLLSVTFNRLRETAAPVPAGEPGRPSLRSWLVELLLRILPLDGPRRAAQRQSDAFAQHALDDPDVASVIARSDDRLRELLASLVRRARAEGEIPEHVDPVGTAWAVLALAQGLAAQLLYQPQPESEVRQKVDAVISALIR